MGTRTIQQRFQKFMIAIISHQIELFERKTGLIRLEFLDLQAFGVHHRRMSYRVYIDESGDHTYYDSTNPGPRFLGLTAVAFRRADYDPEVFDSVEALKRRHFTYDVDCPPVLIRKQVIERGAHFGVLREPLRNKAWEEDLIAVLSDLPMQVFTVVVDKKAHKGAIEGGILHAYNYVFTQLLSRIAMWLSIQNDGVADVMPEARGKREDRELQAVYEGLRSAGCEPLTATQFRAVFPEAKLLIARKESNIAGLQIADLVAAEQKILTVQEALGVDTYAIGRFGERINSAISGKVRSYGRRLV